MRGRGVEKYLLYADLGGVWARASRDSVFVVYQHLQNDAMTRTADVQRRLRDLTTHLAIASAWAVQWGDVAFLVAAREGPVAARVRRTLNEHVRRHGATLSEAAGQPSRSMGAALVDGSESSRFARLVDGDTVQAPKMTNVGQDDIVEYLNAVQVRPTYGAVAKVIGGIAQSIGARLGGVAGQRPEASWVVNATTGLPTGYLPEQRHPALLRNSDIITSPDDLRQRVAKWRAVGASSRPTSIDGPSASRKNAPVLRKQTVSAPPPPQPTPTKLLSVDDLADLRRKLTALLNSFDTADGAQTEGIRKRINRLSYDGGPIPRAVAALMTTITEMRNSAEYEFKVLSVSECAVVRHAWQAIQEWSESVQQKKT
jgi:hypothetical protein